MYGISQAREKWRVARGVTLPVILGETNLSYKSTDGTDPRIQKMIGAVHTALVIRTCILENIGYHLYWEFDSSASQEMTKPTGGRGFGMVNSDNNEPWYPYYVQELIGRNLGVGDQMVEVNSSSEDIRALGWMHEGKANVLLICKNNTARTVNIEGLLGQLDVFKIDNAIPFTEAAVQTGVIGAGEPFTIDGYTVALLQTESSSPAVRSFFEDGFESGDFSQWTGTVASSSGTATVLDSSAFRSIFGARFTSNGGNETEYAFCYKIIDEEEVYAREYFYIASGLPLENSDDRFYLINLVSGRDYLCGTGIRLDNGNLKWVLYGRNGSGWTGSLYAISPAIEIRHWYCIELHWKKHGANGLLETYLDNRKILSFENIDTSAFGNASEVRFGLAPALVTKNALEVWCDCLAVSTTNLGVLGDINGDGSVNILDLTAAGLSFGSKPGDQRWNPDADLGKDNVVDILDVYIVAKYFGY